MKRQTAARLKLIGVFLIFLLPLAGAYALYYGFSYGSAGTNGGELVSPAEPLADITLRDAQGQREPSGKILEQAWTILQVAPTDCGQECRQSLDETRQIRALLHRRAARVQRVLLTGAESMPTFEAQPDLAVYQSDGLDAWIETFERAGAGAPGVVYLVDPLGNWMLYYPPDGDGEALFEDIKHLLKLSHIG